METLIISNSLLIYPFLAIWITKQSRSQKEWRRLLPIVVVCLSAITLLSVFANISTIYSSVDAFLFPMPFLLIWIGLLQARPQLSKQVSKKANSETGCMISLGAFAIILSSIIVAITTSIQFEGHGNKQISISNELHRLRIEERLTGVPLESWGKEIAVYEQFQYFPFFEKRIIKKEYDAHYGKSYPEEVLYKLSDDWLIFYSNEKVKGSTWEDRCYLGDSD